MHLIFPKEIDQYVVKILDSSLIRGIQPFDASVKEYANVAKRAPEKLKSVHKDEFGTFYIVNVDTTRPARESVAFNYKGTEETVYKTYKILPGLWDCVNGSTDWPARTNVACWYCCHRFETRPVPTVIGIVGSTYKVKGVFCSFSCSSAYGSIQNHAHNYSLMKSAFKTLFPNIKPPEKIHSAPPKESLMLFGGPLTIEDFRRGLTTLSHEQVPTSTIYKTLKFPLMSVNDAVEQITTGRLLENRREEMIRAPEPISNPLDRLMKEALMKQRNRTSKPLENVVDVLEDPIEKRKNMLKFKEPYLATIDRDAERIYSNADEVEKQSKKRKREEIKNEPAKSIIDIIKSHNK